MEEEEQNIKEEESTTPAPVEQTNGIPDEIEITDPVAQGILKTMFENWQLYQTQAGVAEQMFNSEVQKIKQKMKVPPMHPITLNQETGKFRFTKPSPQAIKQLQQQLQQQQQLIQMPPTIPIQTQPPLEQPEGEPNEEDTDPEVPDEDSG